MNFPVSKTLFIWLAVVFATAVAFFYFYQPANGPGKRDKIFCTQEAKLCSDGKTYVGRTGPNCEFAKCPAQEIPTPSVGTIDISGWKTYRNEQYGFEFRYPMNWKIEGNFNEDSCCLNIFNNPDPYEGEHLKRNVMKAQFQRHVNKSIVSKNAYIEFLIKENIKDVDEGSPTDFIDANSLASVKSTSGIEIVSFQGGVGDFGYIIPLTRNFSEVLYIIVWNNDDNLEKVLSVFKFIQ